MTAAVNRFLSFVASERSLHLRRLRFAVLMCVLLVALILKTQWSVLKPGLAILLAGQAGVAIALLFESNRLAHTLRAGAADESSVLGCFAKWFGSERRFVSRLALFESACQMAGLALLGYEFWLATRSLWLALAIGVVYPATTYLGVVRRKNARTLQRLRTGQEEFVGATVAND